MFAAKKTRGWPRLAMLGATAVFASVGWLACGGKNNNSGEDPEERLCSLDVDCVDGYFCEEDGTCSQQCDPAGAGDQCGEGEECTTNGRCVLVPVTCDFPSDCDEPPGGDVFCDGDTSVKPQTIGRCVEEVEGEGATCRYDDERTPCLAGCDDSTGLCVIPEACFGVTCDPPGSSCDGDVLVSYSGAGMCVMSTGECDYSGVEERTNCTQMNQVCRNGRCEDPSEDPCEGVTCDMPPADSCDGDTLVSYSGDGMCVMETGDCDYSGVETRTDCTMDGKVCRNGACVEAMANPCDGVTCDMPPADSCDGDTLVSYSGDGVCDMGTGDCDYSAAETRTDCTMDNKVCQNGACVEAMANPCDGVTCDMPPADACDGDTLVSHQAGAMGTCDMMTGMCDYSTAEVRTDCTMTGEVCQGGACVDLCMGVTCAQPADACDMDVAVTYSGDGTCDPLTGMCDYSAVETRTDCAAMMMTCMTGACL